MCICVGRFLFKNVIEWYNVCRIFVACNDMPDFGPDAASELSIMRRLLIVPFLSTFSLDELQIKLGYHLPMDGSIKARLPAHTLTHDHGAHSHAHIIMRTHTHIISLMNQRPKKTQLTITHTHTHNVTHVPRAHNHAHITMHT